MKGISVHLKGAPRAPSSLSTCKVRTARRCHLKNRKLGFSMSACSTGMKCLAQTSYEVKRFILARGSGGQAQVQLAYWFQPLVSAAHHGGECVRASAHIPSQEAERVKGLGPVMPSEDTSPMASGPPVRPPPLQGPQHLLILSPGSPKGPSLCMWPSGGYSCKPQHQTSTQPCLALDSRATRDRCKYLLSHPIHGILSQQFEWIRTVLT